MPALTPELLLGEIEDVLRSIPSELPLRSGQPHVFAWIGRAAALVSQWNAAKGIGFDLYVQALNGPRSTPPASAVAGIITTLQQARHDLRLTTVGPLSVVVGRGEVFDYFDELRKVIAASRSEIFFVDPYLDAEFASRYLPQVPSGVEVRLLGRHGMQTLLPAVALARTQMNLKIQIKSCATFHDRYLFIDGAQGYQSGASFKDGARNSPTTLTQITDAFQEVKSMYEGLWFAAQTQV